MRVCERTAESPRCLSGSGYALECTAGVYLRTRVSWVGRFLLLVWGVGFFWRQFLRRTKNSESLRNIVAYLLRVYFQHFINKEDFFFLFFFGLFGCVFFFPLMSRLKLL